jgi:hypothetical protein
MNAFTPITPSVAVVKVDPRLAFLARAAARFELVKAGEMQLDDAFDGLIEAFTHLVTCSCERPRSSHAASNGGGA